MAGLHWSYDLPAVPETTPLADREWVLGRATGRFIEAAETVDGTVRVLPSTGTRSCRRGSSSVPASSGTAGRPNLWNSLSPRAMIVI
jgi:hypothetical protein